MAKVPSGEDDLLWRGERFEIRAMRRRNGSYPAKEWVDGLEKKGQALFLVAAKITETNFQSGRPGDRAEKVKTSSAGLWELKVTKPGSAPPHHRMLFVRDGDVLWATHGFTKKTNKLPQAEIETGDRIAAEWKEGDKRGR
jgi:phage-related protein